MMDAVDPVQHYLGNAIEMNRQRKQEEISALKERNAQLKELVKQAEIYAAVLDPNVKRSYAELVVRCK
ncbi:hypothetical protein PDJAM_G00085660 [Pangasius djambal]|uniref:Uncharacterized protein n=1 Tax=Pangasius djambal TaxID=1691987 RepID=A0ACC5Z4X0_9TELE|nr:hypothetical protein [Pangasius djambal]